jgi:DNA-binding transcriptional MocR family regulator
MNKRQVAIVPNNIGRYIKNGRDLRVYIAIISHRNSKTKECFPGRKRIAELTGIDESAISRSLTRLENGGFIQRKKRYNNSNEYLFTSIDEIEAIYNEHSGGDTNCHIESDGKHNIDNDTIDHIGSDVLQHTNKEVNIEVNIKNKVISGY